MAWALTTCSSMPASDVAFILDHAERLVKVASMCVISLGLAEGLNDALRANRGNYDHGWYQATRGFKDGTLKRATELAYLLLDSDTKKVSFQTVHSRLKSVPVRVALKQALSKKYGEGNLFPPSRDELIETFLQAYRRINWKVHGRLVHFRNLGVAHLTTEKRTKSISIDELRRLVAIISELAEVLQQLCQTQTAFSAWMLEEYREYATRTVMRGKT